MMSKALGGHQRSNRGTAAVFGSAAQTYDTVIPFFAFWADHAIGRTPLRTGDRVLDVATGRGAILFGALERVGPGGHVTGIDLADEMVAMTQADLDGRRIVNARVELMDAEALTFADTSFDVVICAFAAFMFSHPEAAFREFHRVLAAGGHLMLTTWSGEDPHWAFLGPLIFRTLGPDAGPPPSNPFKEEGSLSGLLAASGFTDVKEEDEEHVFHFRDVDQWLQWQASHGGRAYVDKIAQRDPAVMAEFRQGVERETRALRDSEGLPLVQRARYTLARSAGT
jgi:ubiquinone/menaquinone biosynthesis C-methylase UbiE